MKGAAVLLSLVLVNLAAASSLKWYEMEAAKLNKDSRLSEEHIKSHWEEFKRIHSKVYKTMEEEASRFKKFSANFIRIMEHNIESDAGKHSYRLGINEYSDLDSFEINTRMNGYRRPAGLARSGCKHMDSKYLQAPKSVDWRKEGYVTPVKNQGQCGSCWAFSTTGSLEGQHFRSTKKLVSLSEQNLVDCSRSYGNNGCEGGLMDNAFKYIRDNKGLDTEGSYPYEAEDDTCRFERSDIGADDTGFCDIDQSEEALQKAVASVGPISIAIDASHPSFQSYSEGVYIEPECGNEPEDLDHGVLIVGYGNQDGQDYWLVKNSWGESWGEDGFIKMARNKNNQCGVATQASYPLV